MFVQGHEKLPNLRLRERKFGAPPGTRTPNQLIKSQLLYH
jgi:hypothetical protein